MSSTRRPADVALSIAAALGALCLLAAAAGFVLGVRPLLFRSGSMSPAIHTGDLAFARSVPAAALHVGDVVSVPDGTGHRVTHRVVAVTGGGDTRVLRLKGDANARPDDTAYPVTRADRVVLSVPKAGYLLGGLASGPGLVLLGAYGALLLHLLVRGDRREPPPGRRRRRHARAAAAAGVAAVVGGGGSASAAPWTDAVGVSAPLAAAVMGAPVTSCSGAGLLSRPTISWATPAGPAPSSYLVTYTSAGGSGTATVSGTSWQMPNGLLDVLTTYTITVQSVRGSWQSAASNAQRVSVTNALGLGVLTACL